MKRCIDKNLPILTAVIALIGVFTAINAWSAFSSPYEWRMQDNGVCRANEMPQKPAAKKSIKNSRAKFARFRPVERYDIAKEADALLQSKTTIQEIYDKEFTERVQREYNEKVGSYERVIDTPYRKANTWDYDRFNDSRHDMAKWVTKEILNDQLREFFHRGDKNSAPMQVLTTMREISGGNPTEEENKKLTPEQKIARAHRLDLPKVEEEEEHIPTRLRPKMNLIKQTGQLRFQNPVVETSVNIDAHSDEKVLVDMNKDFKKLTLKSNVRYGVQKQMVQMNLNKKITDEVSLDLSSERYTGDKRGASGERKRDTARVTYSLSF